MNFVFRTYKASIKVLAATSLATVLSVSMPMAALAQDQTSKAPAPSTRPSIRKATAQKPDETKADVPADNQIGGTGVVSVGPVTAMSSPQSPTQSPTQNPNQTSITQPIASSPEP